MLFLKHILFYGTFHCYITTVVNVFWPLGKQLQLAVVITSNPYSHLLKRKLDEADCVSERSVCYGVLAFFVRLA